MKEKVNVKKWQLLRWRSKRECADLSAVDFVAVGRRAFYKNRTLEQVTLPANAAVIKTEAFLGCRHLACVTLPSENSVGIAGGAFANCTRLRELENSELIARIGARAFENCHFLPTLSFGRELRSIGEYAFLGCASLTSLNLPSSLDSIGKGAFMECTELTSVHVEDGVPMLAPDAFRNCISLQDVQFSASLRALPVGVLRGCASLTEITVPSNIRTVGARAFADCTRLESVELESGVERICARAFAGCDRLRSVTVPNTVKRIGFGAFGFGRTQEKISLLVETEYMKKRLQTRLKFALSAGRVQIIVTGKSIEERRRERRRAELEQKPAHLFEQEDDASVKNREDRGEEI